MSGGRLEFKWDVKELLFEPNVHFVLTCFIRVELVREGGIPSDSDFFLNKGGGGRGVDEAKVEWAIHPYFFKVMILIISISNKYWSRIKGVASYSFKIVYVY